MAWIRYEELDINTNAISDITRDGRSYWIFSGHNKLVNITRLGLTPEDVLKEIKDAERAERRAIFTENKDEILEALAARLGEEISEKVADKVAEKVLRAMHVDKSGVSLPGNKRLELKK